MSSPALSFTARSFTARSFNPQPARGIAERSHLRITARGRAVLLTLIAAPLVAAALMVGIGASAANGSSSSTPLTEVTVVGGETLWGLAHAIAPNSDPRDVIANIMAVNQLKSAEIQPGERLAIPAQYDNAGGSDRP